MKNIIVFDLDGTLALIDERINELNIKRQEIEFIVPDTLIINQYIESYNHIDEGSANNNFNKQILGSRIVGIKTTSKRFGADTRNKARA